MNTKIDAIIIAQQPKTTYRYVDLARKFFKDSFIIHLTGKNYQSTNTEADKVVTLDEYNNHEEFYSNLKELDQSYNIKLIWYNSEFDVIRTAKVRELYDVDGMNSDEASLFIDKTKMKMLFEGLPIRIAHASKLNTNEDLSNHLAKSDSDKLVIKPISGVGSREITIIDRGEVLKTDFKLPLEQNKYMIEDFKVGELYHIDFVSHQNKLFVFSVSKYLNPPHLFREKNVTSYMIDEDSVEYNLLYKLTHEMIIRNDVFRHTMISHLEVFLDHDGNCTLGEIACREGGGYIPESIKTAYGKSLAEISMALLSSFGNFSKELVLKKERYSGVVLFTRNAEVKQDFGSLPPYVKHFWASSDPKPASNSADAKIKMIVTGGSCSEVKKRIQSIEKKFQPGES